MKNENQKNDSPRIFPNFQEIDGVMYYITKENKGDREVTVAYYWQ